MAVKSEKEKLKAAKLVREKWQLPKDAEVEFHKPSGGNGQCKHCFVMKSAQWIECVKCGWGLMIGFNDMIVNGHLYSSGRKVI